MWIHEYNQWPNFTWDSNLLAAKLAEIRYLQGYLLGKMETLGFELKREATLINLTNDVVNSSAIEGENLDPEEVRSSIAKRLGIDIGGLATTNRDVEGIVELMLDATQRYDKTLTEKRLFDWHASLFPAVRNSINLMTVGAWRTLEAGPMQVVSGAHGREKVHFEAPSADRLEIEMTNFLHWFETKDSIDPILKAGIAHLWFVTIHPFEDGNGRIARAIGDMALARADRTSNRFYSISKQIAIERKEYYIHLEQQQRGTLEITAWLIWFLDCLGRAISNANDILSHVLFSANLWKKINQHPINERQRLIISMMLDREFKGFINTSKYAKLAKCSTDTALRDIQDLKIREILIQNPGSGRSTSYRLPKLDISISED